MSWDDIKIHASLLQDEVRTRAYERAIGQLVRPHHRVLDFGCGSGILSFFAARAGAKTVYAIDRSKFIRAARIIARQNRLSNILFFHGEADEVELPEKVDIIVTETMGNFVFYEGMFEPLRTLRDRYLVEGGAVIPREIRFHAGFVCDPSMHREWNFFHGKPYGFDFSPVADWLFCSPDFKKCSPDQILGSGVELARIDLATYQHPPDHLEATLTSDRSVLVHGLCGWFDALLTDDIILRTGPHDPPTMWNQVVFPLPRPIQVDAGQQVRIRITPTRDTDGKGSVWRWAASTREDTIEMDSFVHVAWLRRDLAAGRLE